ncbi:MAG: MlaD family protein [Bacteroidales bacterium]|jgi:phospholipid/cholesterol/gamma-HCH transport system substrate-binding protein|nr:MlaD family protein [Bacteroidales bacterium]
MKLSKEIKIAVISIATIVAFILMANFLKGKNLMKPEQTYYAYYDNANNLTSSCAVFLRGMKVGRVEKLEFTNAKNPRIKVTFIVNERLDIPKNSIARITTADMLGTKIIDLQLGSDDEFLKTGDTLAGEVETDAITEVTAQLMPVKDKIERLATSLDSLITTMNAMFTEQAQLQIRNGIRDLSASLNNVKNLTSSASKVLEEQRENLDTVLKNFAKISEDLNKAELSKTVAKLQSTLDQTEQLMKKINEGEGSAAQLVNDKKLYEELKTSAENLSKLLEDLKANPKRYLHFSVFGKKAQ